MLERARAIFLLVDVIHEFIESDTSRVWDKESLAQYYSLKEKDFVILLNSEE